jgi:hypothetical protein
MVKVSGIKGFSLYTITDSGEIKRAGKEVNTWIQHGYKVVSLRGDNGMWYNRKVHRLVADAFIENPFGYEEVNHINRDRGDNRPYNLEWCTHKQNMLHAKERRDANGKVENNWLKYERLHSNK